MASNLCSIIYVACFLYSTPKLVRIKSPHFAMAYRIFQLLLLLYVIGYSVIYKKGYQEFEYAQGSVVTKVKGVVYKKHPVIGPKIYDSTDSSFSGQETHAFFIMTRVIPTLFQTTRTCPENPTVQNAICSTADHCMKFKDTILPNGNGPVTGNCVPSDFEGWRKMTVCEVFAWCPVENDNVNRIDLEGSSNFTVLIKSHVYFPKFQVTRTNIKKKYTNLKCRWKPENQLCPLFVIDDITKAAGVNYSSLAKKGGIIQISIDWTCNLDYGTDKCWPNYSFRRLDAVQGMSQGFNFRHSHISWHKNYNGIFEQHRNLYKMIGIRFLISIEGQAGKFSSLVMIRNIGSGLALLGLATVITDILVLYVSKARTYYRKVKYVDVEKGKDTEEVPEADSTVSQPTSTFQQKA